MQSIREIGKEISREFQDFQAPEFFFRSLIGKRKHMASNAKLHNIDWDNLTIDSLEAQEIDPLQLNSEGYIYLIPRVVNFIFDNGNKAMQTYFCHTFLFQIFLKRFPEMVSQLSMPQRAVLWKAISVIYDEIGGMYNDPFWVSRKPKIHALLTDSKVL